MFRASRPIHIKLVVKFVIVVFKTDYHEVHFNAKLFLKNINHGTTQKGIAKENENMLMDLLEFSFCF